MREPRNSLGYSRWILGLVDVWYRCALLPLGSDVPKAQRAGRSEGPEEEKQPECPRCGNPGPHDTAVRSGKLGDISIVDVAWRCRKCGHEWGFEYFHDKEGPRGDQSTRGNLPREPSRDDEI